MTIVFVCAFLALVGFFALFSIQQRKAESATGHCLRYLEEDLFDVAMATLTELGCNPTETVVENELQGVDTVGQLVTALAGLTSRLRSMVED